MTTIGIADIAEGRAFVYYGSATGLGNTAVWTAESDQAEARFGASVGTAGDVNGDGYADIIVGAPFHNNVYIFTERGYNSSTPYTLRATFPEN